MTMVPTMAGPMPGPVDPACATGTVSVNQSGKSRNDDGGAAGDHGADDEDERHQDDQEGQEHQRAS